MKFRRLLVICAASILLVAGDASAQFVNSDFENGSEGWTSDLLAGWTVGFPADGGNPDGRAWIMSPFGDSGGMGSISQEFDCGATSEEVCVITFDFMLESVDASSMTARVKVFLDGEEVYVSPPSDFIDWTTVAVYPSCGLHTITPTLEVDAGNNGWRASFDNFVATCGPVGTEARTWSSLKSLYR